MGELEDFLGLILRADLGCLGVGFMGTWECLRADSRVAR